MKKNQEKPQEEGSVDKSQSPRDRVREHYEEERELLMLHSDELKREAPDLYGWLQSIVKVDYVGKKVLMFMSKKGTSGDKSDRRLVVYLYTDNHVYAISGRPRTLPTALRSGDGGYLGCVASSRKPRVGEDWTRGSDLADGDWNQETWDKIVRSIVSYELKDLEI